MPRSHNMVLHRIANPGPYGRLGSNPSCGVFIHKMATDIIDFILENPMKIPYKIDELHEHSVGEYCVVKRNILISLDKLPNKLESIASEVKSHKGRESELREEVLELAKEYITSLY